MIKIERLRFRYIWSMMTWSIHECWNVRTNKCVRTNICKKSVFIVSVRNINNCGRILTQFTGLLPTNTVAAKRDLLAECTCLGKSVSVLLRKKGPKQLVLPNFGSLKWVSLVEKNRFWVSIFDQFETDFWQRISEIRLGPLWFLIRKDPKLGQGPTLEGWCLYQTRPTGTSH